MTPPTAANSPQISAQLSDALAGTQLLPVLFAHRVHGDLAVPPFKGPLWRSVLGAALHEVSEPAFDALFGAQAKEQALWTQLPPLAPDELVPAGAVLAGRLVLMGPAVVHADAVAQALQRMGERGLGARRVRATLVECGSHNGGEPVNALQVLHGAWAAPGLDPETQAHADTPWPAVPSALHVELRTPLHLKHGDELVRGAPEPEQLLRRLLARLVLLWPRDMSPPPFAPGERDALLAEARRLRVAADRTGWYQSERYSARQQQTVPVSGIVGTLRVEPHAAGDGLAGASDAASTPSAQRALWTAYRWLRLAEWIGVGGKVTNGQGAVRCRLV